MTDSHPARLRKALEQLQERLDPHRDAVLWGEVIALISAVSAEERGTTTSDRYRAELYDEVWERAQGLGYGNVTEALVDLERCKASQAEQAPGDQEALKERLADCMAAENSSWKGEERALVSRAIKSLAVRVDAAMGQDAHQDAQLREVADDRLH